MKKCVITVVGKDTVGIIAKYVNILQELTLISLIFRRPSWMDTLT